MLEKHDIRAVISTVLCIFRDACNTVDKQTALSFIKGHGTSRYGDMGLREVPEGYKLYYKWDGWDGLDL